MSMKMRSVAVFYFVFVFSVPSMVLGIQRVLIRVSFKLKQETKTMIFFKQVIQIYCFFLRVLLPFMHQESQLIHGPGIISEVFSLYFLQHIFLMFLPLNHVLKCSPID